MLWRLPLARARRIPTRVNDNVRARIAHHLQQMASLVATTALTTSACACDMLPPPARVPIDSLGASAVLLEEANTIYLDITVPFSSQCTFDSTFSDVEGSLVVSVVSAQALTIRLRPTSSSTHVAGVVVCKRTDGSNARAKVRLDVDLPTAQALPANVPVQSKTVSEDPPP
ncbi:MAG: hypothetical protein U0414_09980 [Polyangiaceae bacterium]